MYDKKNSNKYILEKDAHFKKKIKKIQIHINQKHLTIFNIFLGP